MKILIGHCIRCGAVPQLSLDMGKFGLVPLCTVCWTGLAMCMKKDISLWERTEDWMAEFYKGVQMKEQIEENILEHQRIIKESQEKTRAQKAADLLVILHDFDA